MSANEIREILSQPDRHGPNCPRLQFWDAGEWQAPCLCDEAVSDTTHNHACRLCGKPYECAIEFCTLDSKNPVFANRPLCASCAEWEEESNADKA